MIRIDCRYFESSTGGCIVFGSPQCKNCKNYIQNVIPNNALNIIIHDQPNQVPINTTNSK